MARLTNTSMNDLVKTAGVQLTYIELDKEMSFSEDKHINMQTYVIIAVISCGIVATCVFILLGYMAKPFDLRHKCNYMNTAAAIFVGLQITSFICLSGGKVDRNRRVILTADKLDKLEKNGTQFTEVNFAAKEPINERVLKIFYILCAAVFALGIILFVATIIACIKMYKTITNNRIDIGQLQLMSPESIFGLRSVSILIFFVTIFLGMSTASEIITQAIQTTNPGSVYCGDPGEGSRSVYINEYKFHILLRDLELQELLITVYQEVKRLDMYMQCQQNKHNPTQNELADNERKNRMIVPTMSPVNHQKEKWKIIAKWVMHELTRNKDLKYYCSYTSPPPSVPRGSL